MPVPKITLLSTSALLACSAIGSAHAATIAYNFDANSAAATSNDFGSGVTSGDIVLAGNGSFVDNRMEQAVKGAAGSTWTFDVVIPSGVTVSLTALSFDQGFDWDADRTNDTYSQWSVAISGSGTATPSTATHFKADNSGNGDDPGASAAMALSGLNGLTDTTVTFTISSLAAVNAAFSAGNDNSRQAYLDNLVITGTVVPEPGSLALLGLGGLCVLRRRRG